MCEMRVVKCPICDLEILVTWNHLPSHGCVSDDMSPEILNFVIEEMREL